ncbi:MAG: Mor transcription activator family protein [Eubacteriales bacterium]|nr:Mor transcription activator family protein [Eubacteriales bacterium]
MLKELKLQDIADEQQKSIAELIGMENYIKLVENYGGSSIYIYKPDSFIRILRDKQIKEEFRGDYKVLAQKYNLTEVAIRKIVDEKNITFQGQIEFDF